MSIYFSDLNKNYLLELQNIAVKPTTGDSVHFSDSQIGEKYPTMAPSQLKQLKASLRESGILGPQQSKKQKQKNAKSGAATANRIQRNAALEGIREQFNPFEVRAPARPAKFSSTSRSNQDAPRSRPGVTKSLGEQRVCYPFHGLYMPVSFLALLNANLLSRGKKLS